MGSQSSKLSEENKKINEYDIEDLKLNKKFEVTLSKKTVFEIHNGKFYVIADKTFYKDPNNLLEDNDVLLVIDLEILLKYKNLCDFNDEDEEHFAILIPRKKSTSGELFGGIQVLPDGTITYFVAEEISNENVNFTQNYYLVVARKESSNIFKCHSDTSTGKNLYGSFYKNFVDEIHWDGEFLHAILKDTNGEFYIRTNLDSSENFISKDMIPVHLGQEICRIDVSSDIFKPCVTIRSTSPGVSQKNPIVINYIDDRYEFIHNRKKYEMGYAELFDKYKTERLNLRRAMQLFDVLLYLQSESEGEVEQQDVEQHAEKINLIRNRIVSKEFQELDENERYRSLEEYSEMLKNEMKYSVAEKFNNLVGSFETFEKFCLEKTDFINGLKTTCTIPPTVKCLNEDEDVYIVRFVTFLDTHFHFWNKGKCYNLEFDDTSKSLMKVYDIYYEKGTVFLRKPIENKLAVFE